MTIEIIAGIAQSLFMVAVAVNVVLVWRVIREHQRELDDLALHLSTILKLTENVLAAIDNLKPPIDPKNNPSIPFP